MESGLIKVLIASVFLLLQIVYMKNKLAAILKTYTMQTNLTATEWREQRLKNYAEKLQLSKAKALKRLMLIYDTEKLINEFDRICDKQFWSNNEPGLSFEERKRRLKAMNLPCDPGATQLDLFTNNKNFKNGNHYQNFRLQRTIASIRRIGTIN